MHKKQLIILGGILILAVSILLTLYIFNKQQEIRSRAEKSTTLSFSPTSSETAPLQTQIGDTLPLDIMINPGTNAVSLVKLEILYDSTKFEITGATPFQPNLSSFSQVVEGPVFTPGKMTVTLSIGTDLTKVIQQVTRAGTLQLKSLDATVASETPTSVIYGSNTQVLALGANAGALENVLSNTQPAIVTINLTPVPTCTPRPTCLDTTPQCLVPEPVGGWCSITPSPTLIPVPTIAKCPASSTDSIIVIDKSGSMNERIDRSSQTKINSAKDAAKKFVDIIASDTKNKTGLVSFATKAKLDSPLTGDFNSVKNLINSQRADGYTCHECAIKKVNQEFSSNGRTDIKKVAILLTDGKTNWVDGGKKKVSQSTAEQKALEAVKNSSNIIFYTIGLGKDVNADFLKKIADTTGGKYYFSPTTDDLQGIYQEITQVIARGSISGFVFSDANNNKIYDQDEARLSSWTLSLSSQDIAPQVFTSDTTGNFNFDNLCDGTYTLKEILQPNWTQTIPVNPNEYTIKITGGFVATGKIFGNYQAPPTPVTTTLLITGLLDGIGSRGDNSNPDGELSNKNPLHPVRNAEINIFNSTNQLVTTSTGSIKYSSQSGSFNGSIPVTAPLLSGNYTIKVETDNHLTRLLPGIQNIISGLNNELPTAIFVAGDIVMDNKLNILDYNSLIDCYSDLIPATACTDPKKMLSSDLNDDGVVNQFDYNLFLRELATQPGE